MPASSSTIRIRRSEASSSCSDTTGALACAIAVRLLCHEPGGRVIASIIFSSADYLNLNGAKSGGRVGEPGSRNVKARSSTSAALLEQDATNRPGVLPHDGLAGPSC